MRAVLTSWVLFALASLSLVASGCLFDPTTEDRLSLQKTMVQVVDPEGAPVPFFGLTITGASVEPLAYATTDIEGTVHFRLPAGADGIAWLDGDQMHATGLAAHLRIVVANATNLVEDPTADDNPLLGLRTHRIVELGGWDYLYSLNMATCRDTDDPASLLSPTHDCGLSEPTIEVDDAGTIYASGVCCVGGAPPIWVSRDDGATWDTLDTPLGQREAFGIEGDFAIDDEGNMYFFDIELGAVQVSAWTPDGEHLHTTHQPAPPLVDRPWVRAEGDGTVYLVYNQGVGQSTFLKSTDHGRTFLDMHTFPHNFGNLARGDEAGELLFAAPGAGATIAVYESKDGGATWSGRTDIPAPDDIPTYAVPLVDDAGNRYVVFDGTPAEGEPGHIAGDTRTRVYYAWAPPEGDWSDAIAVSPPAGTHTLAWGATGAPGTLSFAWYGTTWSNATQNTVHGDAQWYLFLATTLDATTDAPTVQTIIADPEPVLDGPMDRRLLDFLQLDVGPDGALHVAYAHIREGAAVETTVYLQTLANLPLASPDGLRHGPR